MGVIIYTSDDKKFRQGEFVVMHKELMFPPTAPNTTYILHSNKFTEKDCILWEPLISHRLIVVTNKQPRITDKSSDFVIIDNNLGSNKQSFVKQLRAWHNWTDRTRVMSMIGEVPIPLTLAFFRVNHPSDIQTARLLADVQFTLPDSYMNAVLAFSVKPQSGRIEWPKKKTPTEEPPNQFRSSDIYWRTLLSHAPEVQNLIRAGDPTQLPKGVPKTPARLHEWL